MRCLIQVFCFWLFLSSFAQASDEAHLQENDVSAQQTSEKSVDALDLSSSEIESAGASPQEPNSPSIKRTASYEPMSNWPVVIGTLMAMVACIFALAWFARRFNGFNIARNKDMEIVSSLSVGTREKITLVKVQGKTLLLGVTSQNITSLHKFESEDAYSDVENTPSKVVNSDFSMTLKGLLSKESPQKRKNEQADMPGEGEG